GYIVFVRYAVGHVAVFSDEESDREQSGRGSVQGCEQRRALCIARQRADLRHAGGEWGSGDFGREYRDLPQDEFSGADRDGNIADRPAEMQPDSQWRLL